MYLSLKPSSFDYGLMCRELHELCTENGFFSGTLTRSVLGREIPLIALGKGTRSVLFVGGHQAANG